MPEAHVLTSEYPAKVSRRGFLRNWAGVAWGTFTLAGGLGAVAALRYMFPNVVFQPPGTFKAGPLENFRWDIPDQRFKGDHQTYIVKLHRDWNGQPQLVAIHGTCTYLGCMTQVLLGDRKITCPCDGSTFRFDGINLEGPASRPLVRYAVWVDTDGQLQVNTNWEYLQEKGEWKDSQSFIPLTVP